jgi:hypothetical protein
VSGQQVGATKATVMARVRRFAALRAARRALVPSVRSIDVFPPVEPLRGVQGQLKELVARLQQGRADDLANVSLNGIDEVLDSFANGLRQVADDVPLPQYRATLTETARDQREEVVALLDLVLEDLPGIPKRLNLIDLLITLLAIAKEGDSWSTVIDPPNVSERTRALSINAPACDPDLLNQILARFQKACETLNAGGDFEAVRTEIGSFKKKIGNYLFVPEVMRCVVSYNLAVRMWHARRVAEARRGRDLGGKAESVIPPGASAPSPLPPQDANVAGKAESVLPPVAPDPRPLPPQAPSLEPPGLGEFEAAVAARVANTAAPGSPSGRMIAAAVDLDGLGQYARFFRDPNPDTSDGLRRQIIALGLVFQSLPGIEPTLQQCGLTIEVIEEEWIREIADAVRARSNELIASAEIDEARSLSDLQSRFLFAATVDARRRRGFEGEVEKASVPGSAPAENAPMHDLKEALAKAREAGDKPAARPMPTPSKAGDESSSSNRVPVMVVTLLLLVGGSVFNLVTANKVDGVYSANQLYALSPMLKSAYRPEAGAHFFMGTMGPEWDELGQPQRREVSLRLVDKLAPDGITEVMLYDQRRTLHVHYVDGKNRYPGWDESPKAPPSRKAPAKSRKRS